MSGETPTTGTSANWIQLGGKCRNLHNTSLMSDTCVTTDNKTNTNYQCCKGVEASGAYTVFTYCVDT